METLTEAIVLLVLEWSGPKALHRRRPGGAMSLLNAGNGHGCKDAAYLVSAPRASQNQGTVWPAEIAGCSPCEPVTQHMT